MGTNNSLNFPNLTAKTTPVIADIPLISDSAASSALKQTTIETLPDLPISMCLYNSVSGYRIAAAPGFYTSTTSNSIAQSLTLNTNIHLIPFCVNTAITTAFMGTFVITGVAGSGATVGIYDTVGRPAIAPFPANPIAVTTLVTTNTNVVQNASLIANLKPKTLYWAAIQTSTVTTLSLQAVRINTSCNGSIGIGAGIGATAQVLLYPNSYSAGNLPVINAGSLIGGGNYAPVLVLS